MNGINHYKMQPGCEINSAIAQLPKATEMNLWAGDAGCQKEEVANFKVLKVSDEKGSSFVYCPSRKYQTVQHEQAFRPIIEGMMQAGVHDFKFLMTGDHKKQEMQIYATGEGHDTVSLGFSVKNSFDGSSAIHYGFKAFRERKFIELCGYRQICSNGMKIRVPLEDAEIIRPELRTEIQNLLKQHTSIMHTASAEKRVEAMQYIVEAMSLLREPVEAYIKKAQKWHWKDQLHFEQLIKTHVGQRFKSKVENQLQNESQDLWGLYNAMTHIASHDPDIKDSSRETLIEKAANMLTIELTAQA